LVNNYESEALFIFISCAGHLNEEEKQSLFQALTAFQKIYRKLLELHVGIPEKDRISLKWFGVAYDELRRKREYRDSLSNLVRRLIGFLKEKDKDRAIPVGRFLVLRFNNEDILRIVRYEIQKDPALISDPPMTKFIYLQIYKIMQEFRRHYIPGEVDKAVTRSLSETEQHAIDTMQPLTEGKAQASMVLKVQLQRTPSTEDYIILPEFMENLHTFNLKALFELYAIPPVSQRIFNILADIGDTMELGRDELFHFILYLENMLYFLQELEESGIAVKQDATYGLIKNPYQLHSLGMIREGTYFASTGLWYQNTIPPSIIRCINPNAIPNCMGVRDRHIFTQISLVTGGFRGTPFDLDSTNRYDWDEEPENCLFRPGYFKITIPKILQERWEITQATQKTILEGLIQKKQWS
jgi:predicted CopG family antitoxin